MSEDELFERLCDPNASTRGGAIEIASRPSRGDPGFGSRLARAAIDKAYVREGVKALRLLEILSAISTPIRVVRAYAIQSLWGANPDRSILNRNSVKPPCG